MGAVPLDPNVVKVSDGEPSRERPPRAYSRRGRRSRAMRDGADHGWASSGPRLACRCCARARRSGSSCCAPAGRAVHRPADRTCQHLRRSGGDRDREHTAADRAARGAGAADRDGRGVAGDQRLARRSDAGVRCDAGKGDAAVRGCVRRALYLRWGELHDRGARRAYPPPSPNSAARTPPARCAGIDDRGAYAKEPASCTSRT